MIPMFRQYSIHIQRQREETQTNLKHDKVTDSKQEGTNDFVATMNEPEKSKSQNDFQLILNEPATSKGQNDFQHIQSSDDLTEAVNKCYEHLLAVEGSYTDETLALVSSIDQLLVWFTEWRAGLLQALLDSKILELFHQVLVDTTIPDVCSYTKGWQVTSLLISILKNCADDSAEFSQKLIDMGFIQHFSEILRFDFSDSELANQNVENLLRGTLAVVYNCVRHISRHPVYEKENLTEIIKSFMKSENEVRKALAVMTVSYLISEDENSQLEDTGAIPFMVSCMMGSLADSTGRYKGFSSLQLAEALVKIAVDDDNKIELVDAGVLPGLVTMMKGTNDEDAYMAVKLIWILSFDDNVKQRIITEPGCVEELKVLEQNENRKIARVAKGALWKISEETKHKNERENNPIEQTSESGNHIFISYAHGNKTVVHRLNERLKADGYVVWIDIEKMGGSTLESMASAVENAKVVLVCASEKYKLSPNCRTEAEYMFQLKKPMVPLMMERHYQADGWLGFLMGSKLYVNFDGKFEFEIAYQMLLKELKAFLENGMDSEVDGAETVLPSEILDSGAAAPAVPSLKEEEPPVSSWDNAKVRQWMTVNRIDKLDKKVQLILKNMDGEMLVELCKLSKRAPDFFLNEMKHQYNLDLKSILLLIAAIDKLDW